MSELAAGFVRKARESAALAAAFVEAHATMLDACVRALGERLARGGRLFVMGNGGSACDAQHVAVEFLHPIIEKRRALPAVALPTDAALLTAVGNDQDFSQVFARQLEVLARPEDAVLGISSSGGSSNVNRALKQARARGLLTIGFAGRDGGAQADLCQFCFVVPSWAIHRIQETHTLLLHLLWDGVHVAMGETDVL
ncbi:MAG TPA: SIS domain-containing protein [Polyangia bacterium]|jgi:D-sedoheptulose 7-phosphate isomerase|nr:SIS domain-containing protein [Polyangia bacterium]